MASATPVAAATSTSTQGAGLSGQAFLYDDFSRYSSTGDLLANVVVSAGGTGSQSALYGDGYSAQLAELDRTVTYNGHPTLKYNQPGGTSTTPALWAYFPNGQTLGTMWFRAKLKFSRGYTTTGTLPNSSNAYKLLGWGWSHQYARGGIEISNTTQYQLAWRAVDPTSNQPTTGLEFGMGGNVANEWTDDGWYDYIIEYHITSSTTATARMWMARDGQVPAFRTSSTSSALPGYTVPRVNMVELGLNFNQIRAANQNQALWYAQWEVVDGDQHPDPFHVSGGQN